MRSEDVLDKVQASYIWRGAQLPRTRLLSGAVLLYGRSLNVSNVGFSGIRGNMDRLRITSPIILARIFEVLEAVKEVKSVYCSHPSGWVALLGPCLPLILE